MSGTLKKGLTIGLFAFALAAAPLVSGAVIDALKPQPVQAQSVQAVQQNTIQVSGQGEISVLPDVAYISFAIQTEGKTAEEAQAANAEQFASLETLLYDTYKLDKRDVQTSGLNVYPEYRHDSNGNREISGYIAQHTVTVTYRDMDNIGTLIDDASKAGVNRVNNVRFGTEKHDEYQLQAMEKAMENARTKAKALAGYAGKQLGEVIHISEAGVSGPPVIYAERMMLDQAAGNSAASTSVQIGELDVRTTLYVTYSFK